MNTPLVSIIIPTFNRAHLIAETLDSILAQTYTNWECIIVDDGSTDNTEEIVDKYIKKDNRFQYHKRPNSHKPGGNGARNYGFKLSKGEYVNWFDSDDIMMTTCIQDKIEAFEDDIDFVVGNSLNFDENNNHSRPYELNYEIELTSENYIAQEIGWITNDALIRKSVIQIQFNEELKSGQEYNFFSLLLFDTSKGKYLKKDVAKRRLHSSSIQSKLVLSKERTEELFHNELLLLNVTRKKVSQKTINRLLKRLIRFSYEITPRFKVSKNQFLIVKFLFSNFRFVILIKYFSWILLNKFTGKGYSIIRNITRSLK